MDNQASLETQEPVPRLSQFRLALGLLIVLLIAAAGGTYAWYSVYRPCEVNAVEDASALLVSQMKRYDKEYQFAATASRTRLLHPLRVLQQIHVETKEVVVPPCMQPAKNELVDYMGTVIRAFRAYEAQEADETIRDLVNQSETHYDNFRKELEEVKKCAPFCIP